MNRVTHRILRIFLFAWFVSNTVTMAASPPCSPCAGVLVDDPAQIVENLHSAGALEADARLYLAWQTSLAEPFESSIFETIRAAGATPWVIVPFDHSPPLSNPSDDLEKALENLASIASIAGDRSHFEIVWSPPQGTSGQAEDFAYLIKRAAVAITGARPDARVIVRLPTLADSYLESLLEANSAAYLDGYVLSSNDSGSFSDLGKTISYLGEKDPGKPLVFSAFDWPADSASTLVASARATAAGFSLSFFDMTERPAGEEPDLSPLTTLANEFRGDITLDPYTQIQGAEAWTFVRGEDLSLRIVVAADQPEVELRFDDPHLRSPAILEFGSSVDRPVFDQRRTASGLVVPLEVDRTAAVLRLERMSASELEGLEELVEVADQRTMPIEEIVRRLQAFADDQNRRLDHYRAISTMHLRFQVGSGIETIEASYAGPLFFEQGSGFDWAWDEFYFNGVKWRSDKLPEIPLVQPEKAAVLPLEINFSKEYDYSLRGSEIVDGRDCWIVDFVPRQVTAGSSLFRGTVWVDRELFARVRIRAVQVGLDGDVLSNEETTYFSPIDANGAPAPWSRESFIFPSRVVAQQLLSLLNTATQVEKETLLTEIEINRGNFAQQREIARQSEVTMVRDTDQGLRYLEKDDSGERVVQQEIDSTRLFAAGGVFYDKSADFPIPLAGVNYLDLDWHDRGQQLNIFFAGALLTANLAEPSLFGSRWDAGMSAFGFFIPLGDELYRDGQEVPEEEIERNTGNLSFFVGRPLGNFAKLDFTYSLGYQKYRRADDTAEDFVLPLDTFTHTLRTELTYTRSGFRARLAGSLSQRQDWEFWGRTGNTDFDPAQEEFEKWSVSLAKTWWLPKFRKFGFEVEHLGGQNLDRFSKYDFGIFGDADVAGYQNGLIVADEANGAHLTYGMEIGKVFRIELIGDAVWASDEATNLDNELLGGIGLEGTVMGPWRTIVNFEVGVAVAGPGDGFATRIVFLKLLG